MRKILFLACVLATSLNCQPCDGGYWESEEVRSTLFAVDAMRPSRSYRLTLRLGQEVLAQQDPSKPSLVKISGVLQHGEGEVLLSLHDENQISLDTVWTRAAGVHEELDLEDCPSHGVCERTYQVDVAWVSGDGVSGSLEAGAVVFGIDPDLDEDACFASAPYGGIVVDLVEL